MASTESALEIIVEQLSIFGGYQKATATSKMVCCPFHDENTPSCGVSLAVDSEIPLGFFNCFGCPAKGPWNMFAEKAGLQQVKEWQTNFAGDGEYINTRETDKELLPDFQVSVMKEMESLVRNKELFAWPSRKEWRSFDGAFINAIDGHTFVDPYEDELMLALPVIVNKRVRGVIKARMKKKKGVLSYVTTKGSWIKRYGLFPYDKVKTITVDFVVLVEGPRDALRLLCNGIPALAVLGAKTFSENKALLLSAMGIKHVYVMPDNDRGGKMMYKNIKKHLEGIISYSIIALPNVEEYGGKLDPNTLPPSMIKEIKNYLKGEHGKNLIKKKKNR